MVHRALRAAGVDLHRKFAWFVVIGMMLVSLSGKAEEKPGQLEILPTDKRVVVLKGMLDNKAKQAHHTPYPSEASVHFATEQQGPTGTFSVKLTFTQDHFQCDIPYEKFPIIPAGRKVSFYLTFPQAPGLVFKNIRSFGDTIGDPASTTQNSVAGSGAIAPQPTPTVTDSESELKTCPLLDKHPVKEEKRVASPYTWFFKSIPLGLVVTGDTALLLVLAALLVWRLLASERRRSRGFAKDDLAHDASKPDYASQSAFEEKLRRTRNELTEALDSKAKKLALEVSLQTTSIDELEEQVTSLARAVESLKQKGPSVSEQEFSHHFSAIEKALDMVSSDRQNLLSSSLLDAPSTATAIASVVNEWLAGSGQDRSLLLKLAAQVGVMDAHLAEYKDKGNLSSGARPEFSFGFTADGSWLWSKIQNSEDFWAAPADTLFMTMGDAPAMLNKLFEGMQQAGPKFRFKAIYKPCRLRPVAGSPGQFTLAERGLLHLEGAPAPEQAKPADFLNLVRANTPPVSGSVGASLGNWIGTVSAQLTRQETDLRTLLDEVRDLPSNTIARQHTSAIKFLQDEVERLKQESKRNTARVEAAMAGGPKAVSMAAVVGQPKPPTIKTPDELSPATTQVPNPAREAANDRPSQPHLLTHSPTDGKPPQAPANDSGINVAEVLSPLAELRLNASASLPMLWQKAFYRAATRPETNPIDAGVPSEATYLQRVHAYCDELKRSDSSTRFATVHFQKVVGSKQAMVELHQTSESRSAVGEIVCLTCAQSPAWQFAVYAGQLGEDRCYLLFPLSMLDKSRYASVYSALIDNLPEAPFSTAAMRGPAVLAYDKPSGFFSIVKKITINREQGAA